MIRFRDFRGVNCYVGVFVAVLGLLALSGDPQNQDAGMRWGWGLCMFSGGLNLGVGLVRNLCARQQALSTTQQPTDAPNGADGSAPQTLGGRVPGPS